jgi:hypothetical protein
VQPVWLNPAVSAAHRSVRSVGMAVVKSVVIPIANLGDRYPVLACGLDVELQSVAVTTEERGGVVNRGARGCPGIIPLEPPYCAALLVAARPAHAILPSVIGGPWVVWASFETSSVRASND